MLTVSRAKLLTAAMLLAMTTPATAQVHGPLELLHQFQSDPQGTVGATDGLSFSPDGSLLAVSDNNTRLRLFDASDPVWGNEAWTVKHAPGNIVPSGSNGEVNAVNFSPDGAWVATGVNNYGVKVWDVQTGAQLHHLHNGADTDGAAFSPDGKWLAGGADGELRVYDATNGFSLTRTLFSGTSGEVNSIDWSSDGRYIVVGANNVTAAAERIRIVDTTDWSVPVKIHNPASVKSVAFSADGSLIAMGSRNQLSRVYDAATGQLVADLPHAGNETPLPGDDNDSNAAVESVVFSADGGYLFTSGLIDGVMRVWRRDDWSLVGWAQAQEANRAIESIVVSHDNRVAVAGDEGFTYVYQFDAPELKGRYQQEAAGPVAFAIEAEDHDTNLAQGGYDWHAQTEGVASGGKAMQALTEAGQDSPVTKNTAFQTGDPKQDAPKLDYRVLFEEAGTYYVWVRGKGDDSGNSIHIGLDGEAVVTADSLTFGDDGSPDWLWSRNTMDGAPATLQITASGEHTLNLWMREAGVSIDKFLLTRDADYTPTGVGPDATPRIPEPASAVPFAAYLLANTVGTTRRRPRLTRPAAVL